MIISGKFDIFCSWLLRVAGFCPRPTGVLSFLPNILQYPIFEKNGGDREIVYTSIANFEPF